MLKQTKWSEPKGNSKKSKKVYTRVLLFKHSDGHVSISTSTTQKNIQKDIKRLQKFGYTKAKSDSEMKTRQYYIKSSKRLSKGLKELKWRK